MYNNTHYIQGENLMKKVLSVLTIVMMTVMLFAGCSASSEKGGATINKGKLMVALEDSYEPMEYTNDKGELAGFDIDFANALGKELGYEIEFVTTDWDSIFVGLDTGNYDCVISTVSITEERKKNMEMSAPYISNGQVIVVKPGDENKYKTIEDLKGKKVGVQFETTADIACQKVNKKVGFEITAYDGMDQAFLAMTSGNVDVVVTDLPVAIGWTTKKPDKYSISSVSLTNEPVAVAIKKDNTELLKQVNDGIKQLQENGTMKELSVKWANKDFTTDIDPELK